MNPVAQRFGENLKSARKRAGHSQEELGYRTSLHRTEISLLEGGGRIPRIDTLIKLAGGLSVRPEELLAGLAWNPGRLAHGGFQVEPPPEEPA